MKGKKGTVGAPEKPVQWPRRPFTMNQLFDLNGGDPCNLTCRKRHAALLAKKHLKADGTRPQPHGGVGRPSPVFVLTARGLAAITRKPKSKRNASTTVAVVAGAVAPTLPPVEVNTDTIVHDTAPAVASPAPVETVSPDSIGIPPIPASTVEAQAVS